MKLFSKLISAFLLVSVVVNILPTAAAVKSTAADDASIILTGESVTALVNAEIAQNYEGSAGLTVISDEESNVTWRFSASAGDYLLRVHYLPLESISSSAILRTVTCNQESESSVIVSLARRWIDDLDDSGNFREDVYGNQLRPTQIQQSEWTSALLYPSDGSSVDPVVFKLVGGINTLTLTGTEGKVAIQRVELIPYTRLKTYQEISEEYRQNGYSKTSGVRNIYQAEKSAYKSDSTLSPNYERSSASVEPHSASKQCVNIIGGAAWSYSGQYIVWNIDVKKSGLYCISFKYRKNQGQGLSAYRRLYIDNEVPFSQVNSIEFAYTSDFKNLPLGGSEAPYLFYLDEGSHEIKLEVNSGEMTDILNDFSDIIYELNAIYRRIIVVTGTSPDIYRDYDFETVLPDVLEDIGKQIEAVESLYDKWLAIVEEKGSTFSTLDLLLNTMRRMDEEPEQISKRLSQFKTCIGSCGTLLNNARFGQIELDSFAVFSKESELPREKAGFFSQLWFSVKTTLNSFVTDYNSIGTQRSSDNLEPVRIWVTGGREQYELLKNLTGNGDLEKAGVRAELQLVASGILLKSIIAGTAPDIMLSLSSSDLINYALRGAILDLSQFSDFNEISDRFYNEAMTPLVLQGKTYGLPVTQAYNVLFYRTDILEELGLTAPDTWDDVTRLVTILNKNNLMFGLPASYETYFALISQAGGSMYNETGSRVAFDSQTGIDAFIKWTRYFSDYGQPITYDAQNRFRTGEMPILIADFSLYNSLAVAAPEIAGLWDFTLMPGTKNESGEISRTSCLTVTASAILQQVKNKEAAWTFMKWWTSSPVQTSYGRELESILGSSSRYGTANLEAFENMPWTSAQKDVLYRQLCETKAVPEVPGGYLMTRELNYAFRRVVNQGYDAKDTLLEYSKTINAELSAKRKEFGLEN